MNTVQLHPDSEPVTLRQPLLEFVIQMERKLQRNDWKTGWKNQPVEAHIRLLKIELLEFEVAYEFLSLNEACKELVDLSNFAMIIHDKLREKEKSAAYTSESQ